MSDLHWPEDSDSAIGDSVRRSRDDHLNDNDTEDTSAPLYHTITKENLSTDDQVNQNQSRDEESDLIPPPVEYATSPTEQRSPDDSAGLVPLPLRKSKSAPNPFKKLRPKIAGGKISEERKQSVGKWDSTHCCMTNAPSVCVFMFLLRMPDARYRKFEFRISRN